MMAKVQKQVKAKTEVVAEPEAKESNIKAVDFVPVWQQSNSCEQVAEHFGKTALWASMFATRLRAKGVGLKKMERAVGGRRLDIDELNALVEKSTPPTPKGKK